MRTSDAHTGQHVHCVLMNCSVMWWCSPSARVSSDLTRGFHELNSAELVEGGIVAASSPRARRRSIASSGCTQPSCARRSQLSHIYQRISLKMDAMPFTTEHLTPRAGLIQHQVQRIPIAVIEPFGEIGAYLRFSEVIAPVTSMAAWWKPLPSTGRLWNGTARAVLELSDRRG